MDGTGYEGVKEVDANSENVENFLNRIIGIKSNDFEEKDYRKILNSLLCHISN